MSEMLDWVKARVRCCSCEGSLQSSRYVNMVALLKEATWKYPVHGNILVYPKYPTNRAVAVLCDRCIDQRREPKYAVEWDKDRTQVEYHRVEGLKDLAPIPESSSSASAGRGLGEGASSGEGVGKAGVRMMGGK